MNSKSNGRSAAAVATGLASAVMLLPGAQSAGATNWAGASGSTGTCFQVNNTMTDNSTWTYGFDDLHTYTGNAALYSLYNQYDPTDLTVQNVTINSNTDLVIRDDYMSGFCGLNWSTLIGFTVCDHLGSGNKCDKHFVYFDRYDMDTAGSDEYRRQSYLCHELGHAVGLNHLNNPSSNSDLAGCMYDNNIFKNNLSNHDKAHINTYY